MNTDHRQTQLQAWLSNKAGQDIGDLRLLAGGASFRRFFRFYYQGQAYVAMDDPSNEGQDCQRYVQVAKGLEELGLNVPHTIEAEASQGLVWMSDLGDQLYYRILNKNNVHALYDKALDILVTLQSGNLTLPAFNHELIQTGLLGFQEYFLEKYLGVKIDDKTQKMLNNTFDLLLNSALEQPQFPMHRDYHCQNILLLNNGEAGIVDFQDAKIGPVTYDAVSFLRDCYIDWPVEWVDQWVNDYYQKLVNKGILKGVEFAQFKLWFDLMGVKRHLKACFSFSRKFIRDHDDAYLKYIPRTLKYVHQICCGYPELKPFLDFFEQSVLLENT
jgi:aminoglycoside/choline kinase family phosphotransferase